MSDIKKDLKFIEAEVSKILTDFVIEIDNRETRIVIVDEVEKAILGAMKNGFVKNLKDFNIVFDSDKNDDRSEYMRYVIYFNNAESSLSFFIKYHN